MEWGQLLMLLVGGLIVLILVRMPLKFVLMTVNIVGAIFRIRRTGACLCPS